MNKINIEEKVYNPKFYPDSELRGKSGIYQIRNLENGKIYVGSANNLKRRRKEHFSLLKNNKHFNDKLQNSVNFHGIESFIFEVIEFVEDEDKLIECEQYWMDIFDVCNTGYNISPKADRSVISEETKQKLSKSLSGRVFTEEHKQKISEAHKGKVVSQETRDKLSKNIKESGRYKGENNPMYGVRLCGNRNGMYGKHHTEESKRKMRENSKGRTGYWKGKKIPQISGKNHYCAKKCICLRDNKIFDTMTECAKYYNISKNDVRRHCNHFYKTKPQEFMLYDEWLKLGGTDE